MSKTILLKKNVPKKEIPLKKEIKEEKVVFSFEWFDRINTPAFNLAEVSVEWYIDFLDTLSDISCINIKTFRTNPVYDLHEWSVKSSKKYDFKIQDLEQVEQMQFRLDKSHGRIHGFLIDNIFYIVWLDPFHKMTDIEGYEVARDYDPPLSSYEKLINDNKIKEDRISQLESELMDYKELFDELE